MRQARLKDRLYDPIHQEEYAMAQLPDPLTVRKADYPIETLFLKRWSPRTFSSQPITDSELNS